MTTRNSRSSAATPVRSRLSVEFLLDSLMEGIILLILVVTPWLFGGTQANHIQLACCGIVIILLLWSIKQLIRWKLTLHTCWVSITLVLLFLFSALYLLPLPRSALQWISPQAARLYETLLPRTQEQPMAVDREEVLPFPPGSTVSLYPGATQFDLLQLLAAMSLFFVVRHSLATPERLKRLAWVLVMNGCVLSIFALIQKWRGPENVVYGFVVSGVPFGPFINRNHFSSYVNFSICLGLGLFLSIMQQSTRPYDSSLRAQNPPARYTLSYWSEILQHPQAVWLLIPAAVCMTGVMASLSRGGILALGAGLTLAIFAWQRRGSSQAVWLFLTIPVIAFGLLFWYGAAPTLQRIENESLANEGRFAIWQASFDAFRHFPLLGTGFGTFQTVEPLYRPVDANQTIVHEHAHSEYMEALMEGGLLRLVLTLVLIWLVLRAGWQTLQTGKRGSRQALILGAWAACLTLAVQSIGEFGIHVPAVAAALAVTAGFLVGLGSNRNESEEDPTVIQWHYFGVGPLMGLMFAVSIGFVLFAGTWLNWQYEGYRLDSLRLRQNDKRDPSKLFNKMGNPTNLMKAVERMDEAIRLEPGYARPRMERVEIENQRLIAIEADQRDLLTVSVHLQQYSRTITSFLRMQNNDLINMLAEDAIQPFLGQALLSKQHNAIHAESWKTQQRHLLAARNLSPLAWNPHLEISLHILPPKTVLAPEDRLLYWKSSDELSAYMNRIKLLHPHRASTWFLCGQQEWLNGMRDAALASWRRSLELSDEFLSPIVLEAATASLQPEFKLSTQEIMDTLIPQQLARQYVKTAWALFPGVNQTLDRKPYMERAIEILEKRKDLTSPENQYDYGLAMWGVDKREQALQHLNAAVLAEPDQSDWRLDLGRLCFELEKYADAREHVQLVLRVQPGNIEAVTLLGKLDKLQRPTKE